MLWAPSRRNKGMEKISLAIRVKDVFAEGQWIWWRDHGWIRNRVLGRREAVEQEWGVILMFFGEFGKVGRTRGNGQFTDGHMCFDW